MVTREQARHLMGRTVYDLDGEKIGEVGQVFLDDQTDQPEWVSVKTGLFGKKQTFVPLADASVSRDEVRVAYTKDAVKDAPSVDPDGGTLSQQEEARLYRHYGLDYSEARSDSGLPEGAGGYRRGEGEGTATTGTGTGTGTVTVTGTEIGTGTCGARPATTR